MRFFSAFGGSESQFLLSFVKVLFHDLKESYANFRHPSVSFQAIQPASPSQHHENGYRRSFTRYLDAA